MREEYEPYKQDRLGNVEREPGEILARDGNFVSDGDISGGGNHVVYELSDDEEAHLIEYVVEDTSGAANTVSIHTATLNDDGTIDTTTQRTVSRSVGSNSVAEYDFSGEPFTDDAIVISTGGSANVRVGVYSHHKEYIEPASEQTAAPGE